MRTLDQRIGYAVDQYLANSDQPIPIILDPQARRDGHAIDTPRLIDQILTALTEAERTCLSNTPSYQVAITLQASPSPGEDARSAFHVTLTYPNEHTPRVCPANLVYRLDDANRLATQITANPHGGVDVANMTITAGTLTVHATSPTDPNQRTVQLTIPDRYGDPLTITGTHPTNRL